MCVELDLERCPLTGESLREAPNWDATTVSIKYFQKYITNVCFDNGNKLLHYSPYTGYQTLGHYPNLLSPVNYGCTLNIGPYI